MFVLNDIAFEIDPIIARLWEKIDNPASHRFAIHLPHTGEALTCILYLRNQGAGVFPIHADIPLAKAKEMAARAGCDRFLGAGMECTVIAQPDVGDRGGVLVQMSSGTTGAPKVIRRTWAEIETEIQSYAQFFTHASDMTPVIACPITHSYGLIAGVLVALHRGHVPVVLDGLNPKYILRRMREVDQPLLYTSPAMLHTLARFLPSGHLMHAAMTSGTVLPSSWFDVIRARTTHLFQQYGCSEVGCIAINPDLREATDIGFPLPHLTVTAGDVVTPGALLVRTDQGRMVDTGDLGHKDARGMLRFASRVDDMINVAGLNVYPQDVERVVHGLNGVRDALVFRVEDAMAGARVGLIYCSNTVQESDIRTACQQQLAPYQQPHVIVRLDDIPRQANGKTNRRDIAVRYAAQTLQEVPA